MKKELKDAIGKAMHDAYEAEAIKIGWKTQESCKVEYDALPEKNLLVMDASIQAAANVIADHIEQQERNSFGRIKFSSLVVQEITNDLRPG